MNAKIRRKLRRAKRSHDRRLAIYRHRRDTGRPILGSSRIAFDLSERVRAISHGGVGAMHQLALHSGLRDAIDERVHVLAYHRPFHESDHVLSQVYNIGFGGTAIEHINTMRNDEVVLDALDAGSLPHSTTSGDFLRRFECSDIVDLQEAIHVGRAWVWSRQPTSFFECARLDVDGTFVLTQSECAQGIGYSFKGGWSYYPHLITLANTREPLWIINQPGNDNSVHQAGDALDAAALFCRANGFRDVLMRGDTAFSFVPRLDGWHQRGDRFIFGYKASAGLTSRAAALEEEEFARLVRRAKRIPKTKQTRRKPDRYKSRIVEEKGYKQLVLEAEYLSEFDYSPARCKGTYRMVVLRKEIDVRRKGKSVDHETRYLFYITNDRAMSLEEVVREANERCDQENIHAQLKQMRALRAPCKTLEANWAWMVIASLAWTLKAWMALLLPVCARWKERHNEDRRRWLRMDFVTFRREVLAVATQIVRHARRLTYRFLAFKPELPVLMRLMDGL